MKVPEAVAHEHYSHRLRYHHSKRERREGKEARDPDHRADT